MNNLTIDESKIKVVFKDALIEVLEERRDILIDAIHEALEDIGLTNAIKEGEASDVVSKEEVFKLLEA